MRRVNTGTETMAKAKAKAAPRGKAKAAPKRGRKAAAHEAPALPDIRFTIDSADAKALARRMKLITSRRPGVPMGCRLAVHYGEARITYGEFDSLCTETLKAELPNTGGKAHRNAEVEIDQEDLIGALAGVAKGPVEVEGFAGGRRPEDPFARWQVGDEPEGDGARILSGGGEIVICARAAPVLTPAEGAREAWIDGADFHRILRRTHLFASSEETRYYLNGVYLAPIAGPDGAPSLRAVATDGHRACHSDCIILNPETAIEDRIVRSAEVKLLLALAAGGEGVRWTTERAGGGDRWRAEGEGWTLRGKGIDGSFPDYEHVFPSDPDGAILVNAALMRKAIDDINTAARNAKVGDRSRAAKLTIRGRSLEIDRSAMQFTARKRIAAAVHPGGKPRKGSEWESLAKARKPARNASRAVKAAASERAKDDSIPILEIGFNSAYISDVLRETGLAEPKAITAAQRALPKRGPESRANIRFAFTDANSPVLLTRLDSEPTRAVVMPMRV